MKTLQKIVDSAERIVFFGGAGVSTESGIPDFRSATGLYRQAFDTPPETILSAEYFSLQTESFYSFYRTRMIFPHARPNAAHFKLAQWERAGKLSGIVTQNIDGLHQMAGSRRVHELHGSIHSNTCLACGKKYSLDFIMNSEGVPRCSCGGIVKPDVVLYGESLSGDVISSACRAIAQADVLIVAGTSLTVQPAASFIRYFSGRDMVVINRDATSADSKATLVIRGSVGEEFAKL